MRGRERMQVAYKKLKGQALVMAIDAGLVRKAQTADGYDIAPFLRFWDLFSPLIDEMLDERNNDW